MQTRILLVYIDTDQGMGKQWYNFGFTQAA